MSALTLIRSALPPKADIGRCFEVARASHPSSASKGSGAARAGWEGNAKTPYRFTRTVQVAWRTTREAVEPSKAGKPNCKDRMFPHRRSRMHPQIRDLHIRDVCPTYS